MDADPTFGLIALLRMILLCYASKYNPFGWMCESLVLYTAENGPMKLCQQAARQPALKVSVRTRILYSTMKGRKYAFLLEDKILVANLKRV